MCAPPRASIFANFNVYSGLRAATRRAGGKDQMVEVASVSDYVGKLQAMGKPVTLLLDPDEGHNPRKPMVRAAYTHLLQRMLQEHLGGPAAPAPSAELAKYLANTLQVNTALK